MIFFIKNKKLKKILRDKCYVHAHENKYLIFILFFLLFKLFLKKNVYHFTLLYFYFL